MLRRFDRYLLQEIFPPFFIGLLIYSFVLLMNQIFLFSELLISRGIPLRVAGELFLDLIPAILAFTIPMAVAMGILAAMSRLSSDWEIVAMKTLGISLSRMARPVFLFAFLGWLVTSAFTLYLAPHFNDRWIRVLTTSVLSRVQFQISPREFNETIPRIMLFVQDVSPENWWTRVFVHQASDDQLKIILAARGRLNVFPEVKRATIELMSGEIHMIPVREPERHSIAAFERHEEEVDVAGLFPDLTRRKRVREKNITELFLDARELTRQLKSLDHQVASWRAKGLSRDDPQVFAWQQDRDRKFKELRSHRVEIHKRFSLPFVCFIFALLGLPLGISTRRGGRTSGFTLSLVIILIYYILITGGEKAAMEGRLSPFLGMWGPNIIFLAASLFLYLKAAREESMGSKIGLLFRHLDRQRRRLFRRPEAGPSVRSGTRIWRRRLLFPAILDRYLMRRFGIIYAIVFAALLFISVIVTIFERLDNIYQHNKPFVLLLEYVSYRVPEFIHYILPVATLTTTLLTLGLLAKANEVTAMKACGISVYRLLVPILILAGLISGVSFYLQEYVVPYANKKAEGIWNRINDAPPRTFSVLDRRWVLSQDGKTIYHFSYFDPIAEVFSRLALFEIEPRSWELRQVILAEKAHLENGQMSLFNGWKREFQGDKTSRFLKFREMTRSPAERSAYFVKEWKEPAWMNFRELRDYIREVSAMGFQTERLEVDLSSKLSFPLVSLVMALLGIPFAFTMGRRGALVGVGLSIGVAITYWSTIGFMRNLGYVGILPVFLAAWGPVLLFGSLALFLLSRLRT